MEPREVVLRLQKKAFQAADARYRDRFTGELAPSGRFPKLPSKSAAPLELLEALRPDAAAILDGQWKAFGHLPLTIDDPPRWHFDYLAGVDRHSSRTAFKLDHRVQPGGADIKIIWEPNRWYQLVRLAMAGWLLDDAQARDKCLEWIHNWVESNPPFTGLNWTSGLETGIRLIQFAWIDALLLGAGVPNKSLEELRRRVLPPHIWYTWRYRSFGSSANNHLLGELAGLIVALARWPELSNISASLSEIAVVWEAEVLSQFAEDGGNKEQALGYHLFSLEFCIQSEAAIEAAGLTVSPAVKERIARAGEFYVKIKPEGDIWDYGDTDNAWVTPLFANESNASREWWRWFNDSSQSPALNFWWNKSTARPRALKNGWDVFDSTGLAVCREGDWFVRFDFSFLGFPSIAPHGHLDALHVSVWHRGKAVIVDPGTGAYYADKQVRNYLADWAAHNSPHLKAPPDSFPPRAGTFLWSRHHRIPEFERISANSVRARLVLPYGKVERTVAVDRESVRITDKVSSQEGQPLVTTRWKFAPDVKVAPVQSGKFRAGSIVIEPSAEWRSTRSYNPPPELLGKIVSKADALGNVPLESLVSPGFRAVATAAYLALESDKSGPLLLTITAAPQ
jgi:hypothetical protein